MSDVSADEMRDSGQPLAGSTVSVSHRRSQSRFFHHTSMTQAIVEAVLIFLAGRLLLMVPLSFWFAPLYPLVQILEFVLIFSPPVWAAQRVASTRREKMSRRFWKLGPLLALYCTLANAAVSLALGDAAIFGGATGDPDIARFGLHGAEALAWQDFLIGQLGTLAVFAVYYTIAVVCTRLAYGGFLRFTMPAGNGRVTL